MAFSFGYNENTALFAIGNFTNKEIAHETWKAAFLDDHRCADLEDTGSEKDWRW
jgi:hypothetical protein